MTELELLDIIDKLVLSGVTLQELEKIKPLIGSEDFKETFEIIESVKELNF